MKTVSRFKATRTSLRTLWIVAVAIVSLSSLAVVSLSCAVAGTPQWAVTIWPSGAEFSVEIAADDAARARGYMFRERIEPREGMLFLFDKPGIHPFWMKNCKVTLDIIWLDDNFKVVEVAYDQQPCPTEGECNSYYPLRAARYVLEVAGGTAKAEALKVGDSIVVLSDPPILPTP